MNNSLLRCRFIAALTTTCLLMLAMSASAQTTPNGATLVPKSDPSGGDGGGDTKTLIATVFGEALYLKQMTPAEAEVKRKALPPGDYETWLRGYRVARTYDNIWAAVNKKYIEREKLDVSKEELDAIVKSVERQMKSEPEQPEGSSPTPAETKGISVAFRRASLMDWKVCKSLYEAYGGRVGMGSLGAWVALDGQNALLKEHLKAGDIKFHHAETEDAFWKYAQREHFADTYPKGERLQQLFAAPSYLWADAAANVEPNQRERIGSALGQDIYRDQLKGNPPTYDEVVQLFMAPAMEEFREKHSAKYEMTDEEIRQAVELQTTELKKRGGEQWENWQVRGQKRQAERPKQIAEAEAALANPATPEKEKKELRIAIRVMKLEETSPNAGEVFYFMKERKFEQYLYDNYGGGRIIHQQFGPEALDARRKLLLKLEEALKFQITDPELRKLAYDYWERPAHPGGFHTDRRILELPWTEPYQEMIRENGGSVSAGEK